MTFLCYTEAYCTPIKVLCIVQYCIALDSERSVWKLPGASLILLSTIHIL